MIYPEVYEKAGIDFLYKTALRPLEDAIRKMTKQTMPYTSLDLNRGELPFALVPERVYWPLIVNGNLSLDTIIVCPCGPGRSSNRYGFTLILAREIAQYCGFEPEKIDEAGERIHQVEKWCLIQANRRKEIAESILVSQMPALERIEKSLGMEIWEGPRKLEEPSKKERRVLQLEKDRQA